MAHAGHLEQLIDCDKVDKGCGGGHPFSVIVIAAVNFLIGSRFNYFSTTILGVEILIFPLQSTLSITDFKGQDILSVIGRYRDQNVNYIFVV